MPGAKPIFRLVVVATIVMVAVFAVGVYRAWHQYKVEVEIQNTFFPLAKALHDYEGDYRSPARNLTQLVPHYISQLPTSRFAAPVEYSVIDGGKGWQFSIRSCTLSQPRLYCYRPTQKFTPDEENRILNTRHDMLTVLRE